MVVDIFDPLFVDMASKLCPDAVERVETDRCIVEKFEPAIVDKNSTLLFM